MNQPRNPYRLRGLRAAFTLIALVVLAAAPLALAAAVKPKTTGLYRSSKRQSAISFEVIKKHGSYEIAHFGIHCSTSKSFGSVYLAKYPKVSAAGKFSYNGTAQHYEGGQPIGSATLKLSGRFVSATKATGQASFSKAKLRGCPAKTFTATWSKH